MLSARAHDSSREAAAQMLNFLWKSRFVWCRHSMCCRHAAGRAGPQQQHLVLACRLPHDLFPISYYHAWCGVWCTCISLHVPEVR
jgi:hypothetical protein